jgi:chromosome partitioning protein
MSRTIAIANQKGGVGKTTTAVNLSAALASLGKRTLLIDLDPQGNATMGCGVDKYEIEAGIFEVLVDAVPISEVRLSVAAGSARAGGVNHLVAANSDLTAAEIELMSLERREQRLREALAAVDAEYDYTLIDCPPSLNILTLNAFVAADSVLVPIQCEYYALEGLSALLDTIEGVRESVNPALTVEGLLRTMYDGRNNLGAEVSAQLIEHFGDQVFRTLVPRNVRLAEAPSHGMSIVEYDRSSRGALAYLSLAGEIVRRRATDALDSVAVTAAPTHKRAAEIDG